jgi:hypothetical protein
MKNTKKLSLIFFIALLILATTSCNTPQKRASTKSNDGIHYEIDFRRDEIESYGALHIHKGDDRASALEKLMQANPTMYPKECANGVVFVKSGDLENGWAWARIRCK